MASCTSNNYIKALEKIRKLKRKTSDKLNSATNSKGSRKQLSPNRNISPDKHPFQNKSPVVSVSSFQSKHSSPIEDLPPSPYDNIQYYPSTPAKEGSSKDVGIEIKEKTKVKKKVHKSKARKPAMKPKWEERLHKTVKRKQKSKYSKRHSVSLLRKCQLKNTKAFLNFLEKSLKEECNTATSNNTYHFSDRIHLSGVDLLRICLDQET